MREIIVDRENGAKAFVLFELTKGNIAEIKDRYILEQLRSAIDSPWSTALPDGIRSALTRSVSEEMEDRFLLENMDKDTDRSVRSAIRSAVIRKPELTIFTSKKRTFPQAFSVRKSVVQAVEKFLQKEKLYVKRDTNVPFSARPEKKALRTAKVHSYPRSILKAQFSMS